MIPFQNALYDRNVLVIVLITSFYSNYGKICYFYPKIAPKMVKTAIFGQKCPKNCRFYPKTMSILKLPPWRSQRHLYIDFLKIFTQFPSLI